MRTLMLSAFLYFIFSGIEVPETVSEACIESNMTTSRIPHAVLLRGPYLQVATENTIDIRWRTDLSVSSIVRYGTTPENLNRKEVDNKPKSEHIVRVSGLQPDTKYYYSISYHSASKRADVKLQGDENNYFYTLPVAGKSGDYRIGFLGDPGDLTTLQQEVRDQFKKHLGDKKLNALMVLGDIAYNYGTDAEYQAKFFNVYKDILKKYALFTTPGNHDYHDDDKDHVYFNQHDLEYFQDFSMPENGESGGVPSHNPAYYSVDIGNIHFLVLDSFGATDSTFLRDTSSVQIQWMKKDLEANKNKDWLVVCTHFPPYTMGSHNSDGQFRLYKIRQNVLPILDRYGVDLFIAGHSHVYERSKLMHGYYGKEADFDSTKYDLSFSSGLYDGSKNSCPYIKGPNDKGTVYVVLGSSSYVGKPAASFPHAAMYYSNATDKSAGMLEMHDNRLDFKWICQDGVIRDRFSMMKNANKEKIIHLKRGESAILTASFVGKYEWSDKQQTKSIKVTPRRTTTYIVRDAYDCVRDTFKVIVSR